MQYTVKLRKFDYLGNLTESRIMRRTFRTKREALAHLERNGFDGGTKRKLPSYLDNPRMHCQAYIYAGQPE